MCRENRELKDVDGKKAPEKSIHNIVLIVVLYKNSILSFAEIYIVVGIHIIFSKILKLNPIFLSVYT